MAVTDLIDTHGHTVAHAIVGSPGILLDNDDGTTLNVDGVAATNVLTTDDNHYLKVGMWVTFSALNGGAGLVVGKRYRVRSVPTPTSFTLANRDGTAFDFTTDLLSGTIVPTMKIAQTPAEVAAQLSGAG